MEMIHLAAFMIHLACAQNVRALLKMDTKWLQYNNYSLEQLNIYHWCLAICMKVGHTAKTCLSTICMQFFNHNTFLKNVEHGCFVFSHVTW